MAYSYIEQVYTGSSVFTLPFEYLSKSHIKLFINSIEQNVSYINWINDSQIQVTVPLNLGDIVKIKRDSNISNPIVDYTAGSILREDNLDASNKQSVFLDQETRDYVLDNCYTKEEVDNKLVVIPGTEHAHDDLYYRKGVLYTRTDANSTFASKEHEHSDIYTDWNATEESHELRNKPNVYKGTDTPIEGSLIVLAEDGKLPSLDASELTDIDPTAITGISGSGDVNKLLNEQGTFTDLSSITGGEVNVQADWTETDTGDDSYIENKPALGAAALKDVISIVENSSALVESSGIYSKFSEYTDTDSLTALLNGKSNTGHTHPGVYYTEATVDTMLENQTHTISDITDMKTDVETDGTFLNNTGNYSIPAGGGSGSGEENVQADWAETTTSSDAYIKNKPIIPQYLDDGTTSFELTNDASTNGAYLDNTGNYSIPEGTGGGGSGVITDTLANQIYCNTGRMGTYNTVGSPITSGTLTSGSYYKITNYQEGDVFSNIGSGIHATGHVFLATGTTPDTWVNGSVLQEIEYATYAGNLVTTNVSSGGVSGDYLPLHGTAEAALKLSTARTIAIKDSTGSITYGSANFDGSTDIEIDLDNLPTGGSSTFDGLTDVENLESYNTVEYLRADGTWGIPPGTGAGEVTFNAITDVENLESGNTSEFLDATGHWNTPSVASVDFDSITDVPNLNSIHNNEYLRKDGTWGTPIDTTIAGFYDIPDVPSTTASSQTFLASNLTWQSVDITPSSLWTDIGAYYKPDNTSDIRVYDTGELRLSDGTLPGPNGAISPTTSNELNIYSSDNDGCPNISAQKVLNSSNVSGTIAGSGLFSTLHQNGCNTTVASLNGIIHSTITNYQSNLDDSIGIHGRAIKENNTKNNAYGIWGYASRLSGCTTGHVQAMELNVHNAGKDNGFSDSYPSSSMTCGLWIAPADGSTYPSDCAIGVIPDTVNGSSKGWYNGILFDNSAFVNTVSKQCVGINMLNSPATYALKLGALKTTTGYTPAHIYTPNNDLVFKAGPYEAKLNTSGHFYTYGAFRSTVGAMNGGGALGLRDDANQYVSFKWDSTNLSAYIGDTYVGNILGSSSGSSLWTDENTYYKPNNTSDIRVYDTGELRLSTESGSLTNMEAYGFLSTSALLNINNKEAGTQTTALSVSREFNDTDTSHFVHPALSSYAIHNNGCKGAAHAGAFLTYSNVTSINSSIFGGNHDSVGLQTRVIKSSSSVNNGFAFWPYAWRKSGCTQGSLVGMEININNEGIDSGFKNIHSFGVSSALNCGIWLAQADGLSLKPSCAAIAIAPPTTANKAAGWYNGILFNDRPLVSTSGKQTCCINMLYAEPSIGLKFGALKSGAVYDSDLGYSIDPAHIFSSTDLIMRVGSTLAKLDLGGSLYIDRELKSSVADGGGALGLRGSTFQHVSFKWDYPNLSAYIDNVYVGDILGSSGSSLWEDHSSYISPSTLSSSAAGSIRIDDTGTLSIYGTEDSSTNHTVLSTDINESSLFIKKTADCNGDWNTCASISNYKTGGGVDPGHPQNAMSIDYYPTYTDRCCEVGLTCRINYEEAYDWYPHSGGVAGTGGYMHGGQAFGIWGLVTGPKHSTGHGLIGSELNVQEREIDSGYRESRSNGGTWGSQKWSACLQLVPVHMSTGGYNASFGSLVCKSADPMVPGWPFQEPCRTYVGYGTEEDSIVPGTRGYGGVGFLGVGSSSGAKPFAAFKVSKGWGVGLDMTDLDLPTDYRAIQLKAEHRIYFGASVLYVNGNTLYFKDASGVTHSLT